MPFEKGKEKTGGRQKGKKNLRGAVAKNLVGEYIETNFAKFEKEMRELDGAFFVQNFLKLLAFHIPKPSDNIKVDFSKLSEVEQDEVVQRLVEQMKNE